jgi:peptide/nickel transport system substrate-binding protein
MRRRSWIVRAALAGLASIVVATFAAGCTRVGESAAGPAGTATRHSWTKPGILRIASAHDPDTLSPIIGNYQIDFDLAMFWGGFLFNFDDRNHLVPELATVEPTLANGGIARDGRTITYHLRRGVRWHDGAPFTADDVIFTWHAIMNPRTNVGDRTAYARITAIDKRDDATIVVHLDRKYAPFVDTFLNQGEIPIPVYPKHLLAKYPDLNRVPFNSAPVGTGPFKVLAWHRGEKIRLIANPDYWRGAPKLKEVDYFAVPDEQTIVSQLRSHEVDLWYDADSALYPSMKDIPGTRIFLTPFVWYSQIGINTTHPPLDDVRVRRALAFATDRRGIIAATSFGVNTVGDGDQPIGSWAYAAGLHGFRYDPAHAAALLESAGWHRGPDGIRVKDGKPLSFALATQSGTTMSSRVAVLLQSQWRAVGVDLIVKQYASSLMFANAGAGGIVQGGKMDLALTSWLNGVDPDDSMIVTCGARAPVAQNYYRFCDPAIDRYENVALTSYDPTVRKAAYANVQRLVVADVPFITLWFDRHLDVASDDLQNFRPAHAVTAFWNTWEYDI